MSTDLDSSAHPDGFWPQPQSAAGLCLVHPTGASSRELRPLESALRDRFRVTRRDRPGWGSERAMPPERGLPYYAQQGRWLSAQLSKHATAQVVFGWSSGAFVALHAALDQPRAIASLWLYEPPLWSSREHDDRARLIEFARTLAWSALGRTSRANAAFWRMVARRNDGACGLSRLDPERAERLRHERGPLVRELLAGTGEELRGRLDKLRTPIHVLVGGASHPQSVRAAERLCAQVRGAICMRLPGLDHLAPLTAPAEIAGCIRAGSDVPTF